MISLLVGVVLIMSGSQYHIGDLVEMDSELCEISLIQNTGLGFNSYTVRNCVSGQTQSVGRHKLSNVKEILSQEIVWSDTNSEDESTQLYSVSQYQCSEHHSDKPGYVTECLSVLSVTECLSV